MATTTTRTGQAQPVTGDAASELRVAIGGNATITDQMVFITEGTLASIPASGMVYGQEYLATDQTPHQRWFYDGSAWVRVPLFGAWTPLPLSSGYSASSGFYTPAYRIVGDIVQFCGATTNGSGSTSTPFTSPFPSAIRPAAQAWFPYTSAGSGGNGGGTVQVPTSGSYLLGGAGSLINTGWTMVIDGGWYRLS